MSLTHTTTRLENNMGIRQAISVEGLAETGIPLAEVQEFVSRALAAGTGVHALVQVTVDKVRGGDDTVALSIEMVEDAADIVPSGGGSEETPEDPDVTLE